MGREVSTFDCPLALEELPVKIPSFSPRFARLQRNVETKKGETETAFSRGFGDFFVEKAGKIFPEKNSEECQFRKGPGELQGLTSQKFDEVRCWPVVNSCVNMWVFPKIGVGPPKSSILIGFSIINHPFWGTVPLFLETPMWICSCSITQPAP